MEKGGWGLTRRLRCRSGTCRPMGLTHLQRANGRSSREQTVERTALEWDLTFYEFLASFGARRFPKGERKALWCARWRIPLSAEGIDAPTPARTVGLPPQGGQYFLSLRKKVPKKARGTATPEAARPASRNSQISAFRALPCPALVFAQACQSLTAFGSCAHWAHAPSRPKLRSAGAERLDAPNKFGASNSGLRAGTV